MTVARLFYLSETRGFVLPGVTVNLPPERAAQFERLGYLLPGADAALPAKKESKRG